MPDTPEPQPIALAPEIPPKVTRPSRNAVIVMTAVAVIGVALILWAWRIWPFTTAAEVTEDAYVRGQTTSLAPQVNGYVTQVLFEDFAHVKRGQILFRIDDRLYRQQVAQSEAAVAQAQASLDNAVQTIAQNEASIDQARADLYATQAERDRSKADADRVGELASRGSVSLRERDSTLATARAGAANVFKAEAALRSARETLKATRVSREGLEANVAAAKAQLQAARVNLDNTLIVAPRDGQVSEAAVRPGQYVSAGSQLLYLVPDIVWVVANYKETQIRHMRIGQRAWFTVDALGHGRVRGHVEQLAPATGSEFSVLRPDNASGNFTKVVQRLPVRIAIDPGQPLARRLRPGMSVITHVDTSGGGMAETAR
ncbi:HlyD family secretion protein [Sphingomonas oryzagri]